MQVDWTAFTPLTALAGGVLIGISAGLMMMLNGRIAGISGILGGLIRPVAGERGWRAAFLAGLVLAPVAWGLVAAAPAIVVATPLPVLVVAGLLVGVGTRFGSGCTSGHGVCGLSRLSLPSLVATLCFMATGFVSVFVVRHVLGAS
ncbi:MAG TPA: YeeE/YedE family protein [Moraxellaceae bacterium]|nr:YeeE/YedE family protein [Moraxellaceae bacterium]